MEKSKHLEQHQQIDIQFDVWFDIIFQNDTYVYNNGQISDSNINSSTKVSAEATDFFKPFRKSNLIFSSCQY